MTDISKTITGGTVSIEDGVKAKEEFAPARKGKVELSFAVPEGADGSHFLNGVTKIAEDKLAEMLGRAPKTATAAPAAPKVETSKPETPAAKKKREAAEALAAGLPEPGSKADLEAKARAAASKPAAQALVEDGDDLPDADPEDLSDILGEPAADPITDKQLSDACVAKADKMKAVAGWEPKKIRALIEEFTGAPGKHNREIPAEARPTFLKRLEALK